MGLNVRTMLMALVSVVGLFFSGDAQAQSCSTYLQDKFNWVSRGSGYYLAVKGTSLNASQSQGQGLVSYVDGWVDQYTPSSTYYDFSTGRWITLPAKVSSHSNSQSFSDRYATGYQPFDRNQRDALGITLDSNGKITITLDSWGGGAVVVTATSCMNEVIYGSSSDGTLWSFIFLKTYLG